jgi:L-fuculose-phosphate aldolase
MDLRPPATAAAAVVDAMTGPRWAQLCVGTAGNVSVRDGDRLVISPSGVAPAALDPEQVSVLDGDDRLVAGRPPSSELALHRVLHEVTGCAAVVHTHSPMATTIATTHRELPAIHYAIVGLGGPVRVAPYALFGTAELAANVATAVQGRTAALLANHGAVTCGPTIERALDDAVLLEWLCALYWRALQVGPPRLLTDDQLEAVRAQAARLDYPGLGD